MFRSWRFYRCVEFSMMLTPEFPVFSMCICNGVSKERACFLLN